MTLSSQTYEFWLGSRELKYSTSGVERSVDPRETIRRVKRLVGSIGVTKIADVTDLDRVGIPNYISVRPRDAGPGISYYNGKGATKADAHAGALMEALERHAAESYPGEVVLSSHYNLSHRHACIDPRDILAPAVHAYDANLRLEWAAGFDLLSRQETFVPLNCVVAPYVGSFAQPLFYSSTNGLASGNSHLEALGHALCEVIERDALAMAMATAHIRPAIAEALQGVGLDCRSIPPPREVPGVALRSLPPRAKRLVGKLQRAGLQVHLHDLTSELGIATIGCTIIDPQSPSDFGAFGGCGTHPDARVAVSRALTEAAQSRLTWIQGAREDLPELTPPRTIIDRAPPAHGETIALGDIPSYEHSSLNEDVELVLERLRHCGFDQVVAIDLTNPDVAVPVVRVVVPQLESWPIYCFGAGRGLFGHRVLEAILATP
jgi:ribosomal protein S12 methylthiotransferase accessory factor